MHYRRLIKIGEIKLPLTPPNVLNIRFKSKVKILENGCHLWTKSKDKDGYGVFSVNQVNIRAHRFSYLQNKGMIPKDWLVMHKCDTPSCVNPDHLRVGTHKDNLVDMVSKNRSNKLKGEDHSQAKLTNYDVIQIKKMLKQKIPHQDIAKNFNTTFQQVSSIKLGKSWSHIK